MDAELFEKAILKIDLPERVWESFDPNALNLRERLKGEDIPVLKLGKVLLKYKTLLDSNMKIEQDNRTRQDLFITEIVTEIYKLVIMSVRRMQEENITQPTTLIVYPKKDGVYFWLVCKVYERSAT